MTAGAAWRIGLAAIGGLVGVMVLGCSGLPIGDAGGTFGTVKHSTWEASRGKYRLQFKNGDAVYTWRNMAGPAVDGVFTESGDEVHVVFSPVDHFGNSEYFLTRTGKCSLALYQRVDKEGQEIEMSAVYERTVPECED